MRVTDRVFGAYAWIFGRPEFRRLNSAIFQMGLRGLGILNYANTAVSGEDRFLGKVLRSFHNAPIIFDVGANVGDFAALALRHRRDAQIHCFEPHPRNIAKLQQRLGSVVHAVQAAVGAESGTARLFDYAANDGSSHASLYSDVFRTVHQKESVSHEVGVQTLDEYAKNAGVRQIALLKIDTEGHEHSVLLGARNLLTSGSIDVVQFEFNEMNVVSRVFLRDFQALLPGYAFYRLLPHGAIRIKIGALDEIFAYQNIVAIRNDSIKLF